MKLKGKRTYLIPLTAEDLMLANGNYAKLQRKLGLNDTAEALDEEMQYAMTIRYKKVMQDQENYLWLTNWAIIHSEECRIIGYVILKGCPNERGEVTTGYVINEFYRGQGYATEALKVITEWIFSHPGALSVVADTEKDNKASQQVLKHLGAQMYREADDLIWWRIERYMYSSK